MKLVIGLAGGIGSGKSIVSEHLQKKYNAVEHRFSKIFEDILDRLYLPHSRKYLQKLGKSLRKELGNDVIVNALKKDIEAGKAEIVVVDGIRYENEVEMLRSFKNNVFIFITAPPELRYGRCVARAERGEAEITYKQFLKNEAAETEKWIAKIEKKADYVIENTGTVEELLERVDNIMEKYDSFIIR